MNIDTNLSPEELLEFKQDMKQIEEEKKNAPPLPDDVSLDFAMSADNLYAVWSTATEDLLLINTNASPVQLDWMLASKDPITAFKEISAQHQKNGLLAIISLSQLEAVTQQLSYDNIWKSITKLFDAMYFVENNGNKYWTQKKEGDVLLKGKISDIENLYHEGNNILQNKKYTEVFDARPVEPGHPKDWILFMENPSMAHTMREDMMRYFGHDGSE